MILRFVILGTDGLWDYVSDQIAVGIVHQGMQKNESETVIAQKLVEKALEIAANESGISYGELKQLLPGRNRRSKHDDTTAVVMFF
jgi:hypothetical protein